MSETVDKEIADFLNNSREERYLRDSWMLVLLFKFISESNPTPDPQLQVKLAYTYASLCIKERRNLDSGSGDSTVN